MPQVRIPPRQPLDADLDAIIQPVILRIEFINGTFLNGASHPSIKTAVNPIEFLG